MHYLNRQEVNVQISGKTKFMTCLQYRKHIAIQEAYW